MTDVPETGPDTKPRRRWMGPLLVASLALNLLVLGAIGGWAWRHGPHGSWGRSHGPSKLILWMLPNDKRDGASAIIERYEQGRPSREAEAKSAREALIAALTAEPFFAPALEQALDRAVESELKLRLPPAMLGEIAGTLSLEERKELAEHIPNMLDRRRRWGRGS